MKLKILLLFSTIFANFSVFSMDNNELKALVLEGEEELDKTFQDWDLINNIIHDIDLKIFKAAQNKGKEESLKCLRSKGKLLCKAFVVTESEHFKKITEDIDHFLNLIREDHMDEESWHSLSEIHPASFGESGFLAES